MIQQDYLRTKTTIYDVRPDECVLGFQLKIQDQLGVPVVKQKLSTLGMDQLAYGFQIEYFEDIYLERIKDGEINSKRNLFI